MSENNRILIKRFAACLLGGLVLAIMVGNQEGNENDFGVAFHEAVLKPRVVLFLLIGVAVFVLMTFWPLVKPYIRRPGAAPLLAAVLSVVIAQTVMNWYDPLPGSAKFSPLADAVANTSGLSPITGVFFGWLAWTLFFVGIITVGAAIVLRQRIIGYVAAAVGLVGAVIAYLAHADIVSVAGGIDHSLGVYADIFGFLLFAAAGLTTVYATAEVADPRNFLQRVLEYRAGLLLTLVGIVWGLLAYLTAGWFGPSDVNWTLSESSTHFDGTGAGPLTTAYLGWLGWVLFAGGAVLSVAACYLRREIVAWAASAVSLAGVVITFFVLKSMTSTAATEAPQYGPKWQNLGAGGFVACIVFAIFLGAALQAASSARMARRLTAGTLSERRPPRPGAVTLPITAMVEKMRRSATSRTLLVVGLGVALFYPPTLPVTWQNVLVGQIGVYLLLAVGLNVVVGWAGLLDLGYIAFYEIGAYSTAYFVGALPVKPPSWLHMPAFAAIPLAVIACLIAGVLLGAPTLRLRGDYLAIVTLGFGEIIQIVAVNNPGGFTGGPVGPTIPHPTLNLGFLKVTFGQDNLPYWYLLLIITSILVVLFYRLEASRVGRAWAAIREDEVAAQASGVNTMRIKLLAFAIGASTSGLAGWFFSTQVGYFDPSLFTLQASILIVAYVVFGGMGSLVGAMAGAAVLTWLPQFLKSQVPQADRQMWVGALVLAMMIFRPAGLLPAKRRAAELAGLDTPDSAESRAVPSAEGL